MVTVASASVSVHLREVAPRAVATRARACTLHFGSPHLAVQFFDSLRNDLGRSPIARLFASWAPTRFFESLDRAETIDQSPVCRRPPDKPLTLCRVSKLATISHP